MVDIWNMYKKYHRLDLGSSDPSHDITPPTKVLIIRVVVVDTRWVCSGFLIPLIFVRVVSDEYTPFVERYLLLNGVFQCRDEMVSVYNVT